jgi:hypothetical protein
MVAEIGTSIAPVAKMYQAGITATKPLGKYAGAAVDGALFGGVNAVGNDQSFTQGAGIGAVLGPLGQAVGDVAAPILRPVTSRLFPEKATSRVLQNAMDEAKVTPDQIADDLARAKADGQDVYSVADAMGYPGQRLASTVARTPSEGRAPMVEFLEKRQAGQGRRIATALSEGFGDPATALQRTTALKEARKAGGDINYNAARANATPVDTSGVISKIDDMAGIPPGGATDGITPDTISGALLRARSLLTSATKSQKFDFSTLVRVRKDLNDMATKAFNAGATGQGGALKDVVRSLDEALASASTPYRNALEQYAKDSKVIDAVDKGRAASMRGRFEDTIPAFSKLSPEEQAAYRAGYADPLIADTQKAATGVNKARPLINDATEAEFPAFAAPGQADKLGARIRREQTMFETRQAALGGSKTADNMADEAALSIIDPSIVGNLLSGNLTGAAKNAILQAVSALKGQPPRVRQLLSEALRETNPNIARQKLNAAMKQIKASQQQKDAIIRTMMLIGTSGAVQAQN